MQLIPDDINFAAYMEEPEEHRIIPASSVLEQTIALIYPPADLPKFPTMLWNKAKDKVEFRPGEVSVWAGVNGHGKSMFLSQVGLDLCYQGERVMNASFEMSAARQMQRMSRQAYAGEFPNLQFLPEFHRWTDGRLWIYDHMGDIEWNPNLSSTAWGFAITWPRTRRRCPNGFGWRRMSVARRCRPFRPTSTPRSAPTSLRSRKDRCGRTKRART